MQQITEQQLQSMVIEAIATLGLTGLATLDDIKKAYRALAGKHHPDKGGDVEMMKKIIAAYELLIGKTRFKVLRPLPPEPKPEVIWVFMGGFNYTGSASGATTTGNMGWSV